MAEPVRLEFWGDEIIELRHFDSQYATQQHLRSRTCADSPSDGCVRDDDGMERVTLPELWSPDTFVVIPAG
jgi:transcription-repair coupling factor (superfamily II helicase)